MAVTTAATTAETVETVVPQTQLLVAEDVEMALKLLREARMRSRVLRADDRLLKAAAEMLLLLSKAAAEVLPTTGTETDVAELVGRAIEAQRSF